MQELSGKMGFSLIEGENSFVTATDPDYPDYADNRIPIGGYGTLITQLASNLNNNENNENVITTNKISTKKTNKKNQQKISIFN